MSLLTPTVRRTLLNLLEAMPVLATQAGRTILLPDLPLALVTSIARSDVAAIDLTNILQACEAWTPDAMLSSPHPLVLLIQTAQDLVRGSHIEGALQRVLNELPAEVRDPAGGVLPAPTLKTFDHQPNNLPTQSTPLIGRLEERRQVSALLLQDDVRLVTLTGPGGTGKTHLVLQIAADLLADFGDGAFFVPLASIRDPHLVVSTIARSLSVREVPDQPLLASLQQYLRDKQLLLVLDNFEQVVVAAPDVRELLAAARQLKVLITSRTPLRLRGEHEFLVEPLALPDLAHLPPWDQLEQYTAIRLFVARVRDAKPGFALTAQNAATVAEICVRLDGLPLALELAAARSKIMTPQAMLGRLQSRLQLLTGGARDAPTHQQTLRGTIEWSYDLLEPAEQGLFQRLAVFAGGCTLEAAETVCGAADLPPLDSDVLDGVQALVDKSLLREAEGLDGESRFGMLQTIAEYAQERLAASGTAPALHVAHAHYFQELAGTAQNQLRGAEQAVWLARLDGELNNLRAAVAWGQEQGDAALVAQISRGVWVFMLARGYLSEGRRWLEAALASPTLPPALRAPTLRAAGVLADEQGDYARATACFEEALALCRTLNDAKGTMAALNSLGVMATGRGDYAQARAFYDEVLALARQAQDKHGQILTLLNLGDTACREEAYAQAEAYLEEGRALAQAMGDQSNLASTLNNLGEVAEAQGQVDSATTYYQASLGLMQELGDLLGIVLTLERLAGLFGTHDPPPAGPTRAALLFSAAEVLRQRIDAVRRPAEQADYDRRVAAARTLVDPATWEAAWGAGARLSLAEVLAQALSNHPPTAKPA